MPWLVGLVTSGGLLTASLLLAVALGVRPWESLPLALELREDGLLLRGRRAWRHLAWGEIMSVREGRAPVWLYPFATLGSLSAIRVTYGGGRTGGSFYVLSGMLGYPDLVRALESHLPDMVKADCFSAATGYWITGLLLLLFVVGLGGLVTANWEDFPTWLLLVWVGILLIPTSIGYSRQVTGACVGPDWVLLRTVSGWQQVRAIEGPSLAVHPTFGYAVLWWQGKRVFISSAVIDGYGQLLALLPERLQQSPRGEA